MVSPARIKTNRLLAKAFNLNDFLDPTRLAHDELQYYNELTRLFDKIISHHIDWLDSPEARKVFYEKIQNNEEYFQTIDSDLDDIIRDTSLSADRIIEKIYRKGLSYGYKDINRLPVFNDACKYGLKATQEYNFELISNVSNDLRDTIKHHIFRAVAEGQTVHEVARAITDSGLKPLEGKTLTAYQRASLIARTEIARAMTTGRLQSYANYGVEKVKILTAGDNHVCPICLEAAHVFNGEKTHDNIVGERVYDLDKASDLVPFHPACRCSVIAHIEHYNDIPQKPIDVPKIMNCASSSSLRSLFTSILLEEKRELSDEQLPPLNERIFKEEIKRFVDKEDIDLLSNFLKSFINQVPNVHYEFGAANLFGTINLGFSDWNKNIDIPEVLRKYGIKYNIPILIHNHPYNTSPFPSYYDFISFAKYGVKYGIVTNDLGTFIVKNNNISGNKKGYDGIEKPIKDIKIGIIEEFEEKYGYEYDENNKIHNKNISRMVNENSEKYREQYQDALNDFDMEVMFIKNNYYK